MNNNDIFKLRMPAEAFNSISAGYMTTVFVKEDDRANRLNVGENVEIVDRFGRGAIIKRLSDIKVVDDIARYFASLQLLKCGYSPFTLCDATTEGLKALNGVDPCADGKYICLDFAEVPFQKYLVGQAGSIPDCSSYEEAVYEIRNGRKESHWIWYVLPQLAGLTRDTTTEYYGLNGVDEAIKYLEHPVLGLRLMEITKMVLELKTNDPVSVFGMVDSFKLRACMTLFEAVSADENDLFPKVLEKYCMGVRDKATILKIGV